MARVLMPLPALDFDPNESAIPWRVLTEAGHEVVFATPEGDAARADEMVLRGPLGRLSGAMKAPAAVAKLYQEMVATDAFRRPLRYGEMSGAADALFLVGGHAPRMKPYLESDLVQAAVIEAWATRPVAAICHGVLVLARTTDPATGVSVLRGRRSTCLPGYMERLAWYSTAWKLGRYYRTYDAYVEEEVREALGGEGEFVRGPVHLFSRGTAQDDTHAFVVEDGSYVSARWPGDAWLIARKLVERLDALD